MLSLLKNIWKRWMKLAEVIGNFQMILLLSLVYWLILALTALPFKLRSDPLGFRRRNRISWTKRPPAGDIMEFMRRQG